MKSVESQDSCGYLLITTGAGGSTGDAQHAFGK